MDSDQKLWDDVYREHLPSNLPWTNIVIPQEIQHSLQDWPLDEKLLLTGCGTGESLVQFSGLGFTNVSGSDISEVAISKAKQSFPDFAFSHVATQNIQIGEPTNVIDWLNLHQVYPEQLKNYLLSLQKADRLLITYIYEPEKGVKRQSYITGGMVFNHDPKLVCSVVDMNLVDTFEFEFSINPLYGESQHKGILLYFERGGLL